MGEREREDVNSENHRRTERGVVGSADTIVFGRIVNAVRSGDRNT